MLDVMDVFYFGGVYMKYIAILLCMILAASAFGLVTVGFNSDQTMDLNVYFELPWQWFQPYLQVGVMTYWYDFADIGFTFVPYALVGAKWYVYRTNDLHIRVGGHVVFRQDAFGFGIYTKGSR